MTDSNVKRRSVIKQCASEQARILQKSPDSKLIDMKENNSPRKDESDINDVPKLVKTANGNIMYKVKWFNDYRYIKIHKLQIQNFLQNFELFANKFDETVGLRTAAFEALYEYRANKMN